MDTKGSIFSLGLLLLAGFSSAAAAALPAGLAHPQATQIEGITYVEQPDGISLAGYAGAWPSLEPLLERLEAGDRAGVKAAIAKAIEGGRAGDGELNLLSQLERQDGGLDGAVDLARRAVALNAEKDLNHFQEAMACFARLRSASSALQRWRWQKATLRAYEKAFSLNPAPIPYRYYLAYSYLQTPAIAGGDTGKALALAEEGIALGQREFFVVRGDVLRLTGKVEEAFADYDRTMRLKIFKLRSFLGGTSEALARGDLKRARSYADYALLCRPDAAEAHEALGDCLLKEGDRAGALASFKRSLEIDPALKSSAGKLAEVEKKSGP